MAFDLTTSLGGGGGGAPDDTLPALSATPAFDGTSTRFSNYYGGNNLSRLWGFNADGDFISLTNTYIQYYNSSGTFQWTAFASSLGSGVNQFAGICKVGSYIYAVGSVPFDTTAYIGRVTTNGNWVDKQAISFGSVSAAYKTMSHNWLGVPYGQSNIYFVGFDVPARAFNPSTLATVSTCSTPSYQAGYYYAGYLTQDLQSFGGFRTLNSTYGHYSQIYVGGPRISAGEQAVGRDLFGDKWNSSWPGLAYLSQYPKWFYWDGYIIPGGVSDAPTFTASIAYSHSDFDEYATSFLKASGAYIDCSGAWT